MRALDVLMVFLAGGLVGVLVQRARRMTHRLQASTGILWALTLIIAGPGVQAAARLLDAGPDIQFAAGVFRTLALSVAVIIYLSSDAPKVVDAERR